MTEHGIERLFRNGDPEHIGILKPSALGDVVQTLPLLPVLRQRFPRSRMTWIIQRELRELVTDHPCLDDILSIERRPSISQGLATVRQLRSSRFDLVFDLQGLLRSAVMTLATGARWRVGLETAREGSHLAANCILPNTGRDVPAHARYWRVAECLGMGDLPRNAWVTVPASSLAQARAWLSPLPRPLFAVQWGAQWRTKRWPLAGFASVMARAQQEYGGGVVIVGGRGEAADCEALAEQIRTAGGHSSALNLAGKTSIKELAAVLSLVDFAVCNDSGPLHLAAELGRPTLGIFTCTSPIRSGPPGTQHEFVSTELSCAASYRKICPHAGGMHEACHTELTAEKVWQKLRRLVEKHSQTTESGILVAA